MKITEYLWEAGGKDYVDKTNPFKKIGFDGDKARLGWVKPPSWDLIENTLKKCEKFIGDKNEFIFIGMGGSINGIKTLTAFKKKNKIYCIDNLDPQALLETVAKIRKINKIMVIPISKSATTKETQLIAHTIKDYFCKIVGREKIKKYFLWLVDSDSVFKWKTLGWEGFSYLPLQFDGRTDIGGRFSSPHTLVFFLPLFLIMNKNLQKVKRIYDSYLYYRNKVISKAFQDAKRYRDLKNGYFLIKSPSLVLEHFKIWITQLFQESLGSKKKGFSVKTFVADRVLRDKMFIPLNLTLRSVNPLVEIMCIMCYLQHFVAYYAYFKRINFVNQPYVEKYKKKMKTLTSLSLKIKVEVDFKKLIKIIKKRLKPHHKFIETVLYLYPHKTLIEKIGKILREKFPSKKILVFVGSDWNHHSYQAAYQDKNTLYILLTKSNYLDKIPSFNRNKLKENIKALRTISYATHLTLKKNSILVSFSDISFTY